MHNDIYTLVYFYLCLKFTCANVCNMNDIMLCLFKCIYYWLCICAGSRCSQSSIQDVVFVIDTSGNIGFTRFQLIRQLIANITTELFRNSPRSAVGVILFNSSSHIEFNLQAYDNLNSLLLAINKLPYYGGGTNTAGALTLLLSTAQNGVLGLRSDSSKVAIVITDGQSDSQKATISAAAALHASNIFDVYAVGVDGTNMTELQGIASSPEFVFFTNYFNYNGLQQLQDRIISALCACKYSIAYIGWLTNFN